jgi:glycosyltransferase involved in cell wall biosynthesis
MKENNSNEIKKEKKLASGPYLNVGKLPIIVMASYHCCIRVVKQSIALAKRGYHIRLVTWKIPFLHNIFPWITTYTDDRELLIKLEGIKGDIIHAHNDPDSLIVHAGNVKGKRKLVFDVHDSNFVRHDHKTRQEKMAFDAADAYIYPSEEYKDILSENFKKYSEGKPAGVTWPLCNEDLLTLNPLPRIGGIVYQGNIHAPLPDIQMRLPYRVYTEMTAELTKRGVPFSIYPGAIYNEMKQYENLGALLHEPLDYLPLIRQLSRYTFGLCGAQIKHRQWDMAAFPNKLGEYLMAGIPILVFNAKGCSEVIKKDNVGVTCESYDEIKDVYFSKRSEELRKNVMQHRHKYTIENHPQGIEQTIKIYKAVLGESV